MSFHHYYHASIDTSLYIDIYSSYRLCLCIPTINEPDPQLLDSECLHGYNQQHSIDWPMCRGQFPLWKGPFLKVACLGVGLVDPMLIWPNNLHILHIYNYIYSIKSQQPNITWWGQTIFNIKFQRIPPLDTATALVEMPQDPVSPSNAAGEALAAHAQEVNKCTNWGCNTMYLNYVSKLLVFGKVKHIVC